MKQFSANDILYTMKDMVQYLINKMWQRQQHMKWRINGLVM